MPSCCCLANGFDDPELLWQVGPRKEVPEYLAVEKEAVAVIYIPMDHTLKAVYFVICGIYRFHNSYLFSVY